jgi:hypothetical protein
MKVSSKYACCQLLPTTGKLFETLTAKKFKNTLNKGARLMEASSGFVLATTWHFSVFV